MLSVASAASLAHAPIRTRYLRTNSFYDPSSMDLAPPHFTVYDPAHKQFFISNPFLNEIDVFDALQETQTAAIAVPSAWGLDISPYNGSLYAGTLIGDVYQINTATLTVTTRYPSASIGPSGYAASTALVLSDGRLALQGGAGGILGVDGFGGVAIWDPATNSLDTGPPGGFGFLAPSVCPNVMNSGGFALSGDRTRVLLTWVDSGGGGDPICSYDPVAKIATYGTFNSGSSVRQIIPTPDGTRFFLTSAIDGVAVFDAKTVQLLGKLSGEVINDYTKLPGGSNGAVISLDGKTLYLINEITGEVGAYDTTTYQQTGWVPSFSVTDIQTTPVIGAIDETGLIAGVIGHGVSFLDAAKATAGLSTVITAGFASVPTGPLSGDTHTGTIASADITDGATLTNVYVGNAPGIGSFSSTGFGGQSNIQVTTPATSLSGAVDITTILSDGGIGISPEAFSYGPTILEVTPNGATAEGGQLGALIGYGFGSISGVQVTVGGVPAPVTVVYSSAPIDPYPFPAQALQFTIPPGIAGSTVDVTVTTPSGSTTAKAAFHYASAVRSFPLTANLQAGIYDSHRNLYYFADTAQIQVLSPSSGKWLSPIPLPDTSAKTQLFAISESPDGTKLAVSDFGGQAIYVLDPDAPSSVQRFPMSISIVAPSGLAITNSGSVYFTAADIGGTGEPAFFKLITSTGVITNFNTGSLNDFISNSSTDRVLLSPDGSRIYASPSGASIWLDTSNDQIHVSASTSSNAGGESDIAVSGDGSTVDIDGFIADPTLNAIATSAYVDWETWFPSGVLGQKLNQDGSILFQPLTDGIDMIARNSGRLLYRIQIPVAPADCYDSLVVASGTNTLVVITASGVSIVDLSSLAIPAADAQPFPALSLTSTGVSSELQRSTLASLNPANPRRHLREHPRLKRNGYANQGQSFDPVAPATDSASKR